MRQLAAIAIGLLGFCSVAAAQPDGVSRVLRTFDFEERRLGNAEDLPMHWEKVTGPGLPHYVNGRISSDRKRSGEYSFRLDLNGGSLIYRYPAGQVRVQQGAHYRIDASVQTTVLPNARARLSAYLVDVDGNAVESTVRHSALYAARSDNEPWTQLKVEISADDPRAYSLVIEIALLQPMHYAPTPPGPRPVFAQDIRGSAWFDDVTVSQVPLVRMSTNRPGNIFTLRDPLGLQVEVSDRFVDDLAGRLDITDAQGNPVYQRSGALEIENARDIAPGRRLLALALPPLAPGWYSAALVMTSHGQFVGQQKLDFVRLADDAAAIAPDPRFGMVATDLSFRDWDDLPQILPLLGAGRVKLAVWSNAGDAQELDPAAFDRLLEQLAERQIEPTACLLDLPSHRNNEPPTSSWRRILEMDEARWRPQLASLIARHANHLDRWQLGADGSDLFVTDPEMRTVYARVYREFASLVNQPDLAMPWPAWYQMEGELPATVALYLKPEVLPSQIPLYVQDLRSHEGQKLSLFIQPVDRATYGREAEIRDLAERVIYALAADATRIELKLPFDVDEHDVKQPTELFIILRTILNTLAGASYRGKIPLAEGLDGFLFDRNGQSIIAVWDRGGGAQVKKLAINLGQEPYRVDLWGNVTPLLRGDRERAGGNADIEVGPMPVFLVNVDGALAQLRSSVSFDNSLLESSFKPHTRKLRFRNPYRQAISGSFKLRAPSGWVVNPPTATFSLNPDEVFEREVSIEFPYSTFAGEKIINADFTVQADTNSSFSMPIAMKLGLSDVGLQTLALRDGGDVIVQQMITNYGSRPIDYSAFATVPGLARQERLVTNLAPGRTTIKKYRFTGARFSSGIRIRSGIKELDGTRILNDEVEIR